MKRVALIMFTALCFALPSVAQARSSEAWVWFNSGSTQCVVNHEGGVASIGWVHGVAMYAGRFQSDYSFETETSYGRLAERKWGRAWNWPLSVQVQHAYEVWKYAGWSRWPTYYRFGCANE